MLVLYCACGVLYIGDTAGMGVGWAGLGSVLLSMAVMML